MTQFKTLLILFLLMQLVLFFHRFLSPRLHLLLQLLYYLLSLSMKDDTQEGSAHPVSDLHDKLKY